MTSRERIQAAASGGEVDVQPTLGWMSDADTDAKVTTATELSKLSTSFVLAEVANPFGLALMRGIDLNRALKDDPSVGGELLDGLVEEVRQNISGSLRNGADGIFYRLHGATPAHCTPMEYGGHYLERDRELLDSAGDSLLNVLFLAGSEDLYVDFVSDLPAQVFAWDADASRISASQIRLSRKGAVASSDPTSEILLIIGKEQYLHSLEQPNIG